MRKSLLIAMLGLMALGACAATPPVYEDVVAPPSHDFRTAPPPVEEEEEEEEPIPEPDEGQFVSANGELCSESPEDRAVVICGIAGQATVISDIISGSF